MATMASMAIPIASTATKGPVCPSCKRAQPMTPESPSLPLNLKTITAPVSPLPITPPDTDIDLDTECLHVSSVATALHVISTERAALEHLETLYQTDTDAQARFASAVLQIRRTVNDGGKLVICGVGKSGKIGLKLVATMNSLGITTVFLHPTEALHGDLGIIRLHDTLLFLTFSGRTAELTSLVPFIPPTCAVLLMTSHVVSSTCVLMQHIPRTILLSAPIHESETTSFGLSAPTSSTTVALALGDALALAVAQAIHNTPDRTPADVFREFHPGGAIGADNSIRIISNANNPSQPDDPEVPRMSDISTEVSSIPITTSASPLDRPLRPLDLVLAVVRSPESKGWVRISTNHIIAPRRIRSFQDSAMTDSVSRLDPEIVIEKKDWISVLGTSSVEEVRDWIRSLRNEGDRRGREFLRRGTILGVVDGKGEIGGVVEIEDVMMVEELEE